MVTVGRVGRGRGPRVAPLVALLCVAAAAGAGAAPLAAQDLLYVASQEDVTVAIVDMSRNRVVETVDLKALGFSPTAKAHHTAVEPDGSHWYVSLIAEGKVLKFDRANRLVGQADFETPGMLALDPASDFLYVGRSMAAVNPPQRIGLIERSTMEIEEVDVFFGRPHALAVDARGRRFFSASLAENRMAWAPIGEEDVELLNLEGPHHMVVQFAVSPDGRWLVGGGQMSGALLVFDLAGHEPRSVPGLQIGDQPWHPVFTPDGAELWVPNQAGNSVTVVDTRTWTVAAVVAHPAMAQPHGSAVSPDGGTIYVAGRNERGTYTSATGAERPGTVVAVDRASREVVAVMEVGRYAAGMSTAARPAGG